MKILRIAPIIGLLGCFAPHPAVAVAPGAIFEFDASLAPTVPWSNTGTVAAETFDGGPYAGAPTVVNDPAISGIRAAYAVSSITPLQAQGDAAYNADGYATADASFEFWADFNVGPTAGPQLLFEAGGTTRGTIVATNNEELIYFVKSDYGALQVKTPITSGWHQVVCTYSDATGTLSIHLDGGATPVATASLASLQLWAGGNVAGLGNYGSNHAAGSDFSPTNDQSDAPFQGRIALYRFYARVLIPAEISDNHGDMLNGTNLPPAPRWVSGSGDWGAVAWNDDAGNGVPPPTGSDVVGVGEDLTLLYSGSPASVTVGGLNLGRDGTAQGQGRLKITGGSFTVTGDAAVGRQVSRNDSFLEVSGGTLDIQGNASFGLDAASTDGSLTISGGACQVGGDLSMGNLLLGGAMMRFHNPGSSPPVVVDGTLVLGRCMLDLTFDESYLHVPGNVISLVEYAARDSQFGNFRRGDRFNCGPNRFRIDYDVPSNGKLAITLTALENWSADGPRPNIVLLFSDDQGYADLSLSGHPVHGPQFPTPAIDSIAAAGAQFSNAYVVGGVCHPSRVGLLTGMCPQRLGTDSNLINSRDPHFNGMSLAARTIPRRLQGLGYKTYGIGKWHLGNNVVYHPNVRGFDHWYGMWSGSRSYYSTDNEEQVFQDQMKPDLSAESSPTYLTDRIGDRAVQDISDHLASHAEQPFFLYVAFTAVHSPLDLQSGDSRYTRLANEFGITLSDYQGATNTPELYGYSRSSAEAARHELAAMTLAMDENVQKILDKLDEEELSDNTLVLYMTDNGGAQQGNLSYNYPLRGGKGHWLYDGAIKTPCAVRWPARVSPGQVIAEPVTSLDLVATFVEACGGPAESGRGLDGLDLLPILTSGQSLPAERCLIWRSGGTRSFSSAVRMGDWKIYINNTNQTSSLYNLDEDIAEEIDRSGDEPEIAAAMHARFDAWEAATLPPFYGFTNDPLSADPGLEREPIPGAFRLRNSEATVRLLSSPLRRPLGAGNDFTFSFQLRSSELSDGPSAALYAALGDSTTHADFVRFGVDYGNSRIFITEGKTGGSTTTPLPTPPTSFEEAIIRWDGSAGTLSLEIGGAVAEMALTGSYDYFRRFGVGATAMEGEVTPLRRLGVGPGNGSASLDLNAGRLSLHLEQEFPFPPRIERTDDLELFTEDDAAKIDYLGGGAYQAYPAIPSGKQREFFRWRY